MAKALEYENSKAERQEYRSIVDGLDTAVRQAILQHKRAGNPIAVWENNQVVWIPAEEIDVDDPDAKA